MDTSTHIQYTYLTFQEIKFLEKLTDIIQTIGSRHQSEYELLMFLLLWFNELLYEFISYKT